MFIRAVVPITLQPEAEATGTLAVRGGAGGALNVKAGVKFARADGGLQREMFEDLSMEARRGGNLGEEHGGAGRHLPAPLLPTK